MPPTELVSTATTVENGALIVIESSPVAAGVNAYQTVFPEELPNAQDGACSPVSMVASVMSTLSLNGRAVITVALPILSFDGATSCAVKEGRRGCTGMSRVHDATNVVKPAKATAV